MYRLSQQPPGRSSGSNRRQRGSAADMQVPRVAQLALRTSSSRARSASYQEAMQHAAHNARTTMCSRNMFAPAAPGRAPSAAPGWPPCGCSPCTCAPRPPACGKAGLMDSSQQAVAGCWKSSHSRLLQAVGNQATGGAGCLGMPAAEGAVEWRLSLTCIVKDLRRCRDLRAVIAPHGAVLVLLPRTKRLHGREDRQAAGRSASGGSRQERRRRQWRRRCGWRRAQHMCTTLLSTTQSRRSAGSAPCDGGPRPRSQGTPACVGDVPKQHCQRA